MADDEAAKFKSGDETIFTIFTGPLKDQTGAEKGRRRQGHDRPKKCSAWTGSSRAWKATIPEIDGVIADRPGRALRSRIECEVRLP